MEGKDKPVNFPSLLEHIQAKHADHKEPSLSGSEIRLRTDEILDSQEFACCSKDFKNDLRLVTS